MSVSGQDLCHKNNGPEGLTPPGRLRPDIERLIRIMQRRWAGESLRQIAAAHGLSHERVRALLAWVACDDPRRAGGAKDHADSHGRAFPTQALRARIMLGHPAVCRLTAKQRATLCWQAQGLILTDIAKRMGSTAQGVQRFLVAARQRLERLEARRAASSKRSRLPKPACLAGRQAGVSAEPPDIGPIDITGMIDDLVAGVDGPGE